MTITIIKIVVLFCFLIIPLTGPSKRREVIYKRSDKTIIALSNYAINEDGDLEKVSAKRS